MDILFLNNEYNYNFNVKYYDIQNELLEKFKLDRMNNNTLEYDEKDLYLIIDKLYLDEILSVFKVSSFNNKKMKKVIEKLFIIFIENKNKDKEIEKFQKIFFEKIFNPLNINFKENKENEENNTYFKNLNLLYFYNLFNFNYFHIFHKIIQDYSKNKIISNNLLEKFKEIKEINNNI